MKNLTQALMVIFIALLYYQTNAQTFAIKGGLNLSNIVEKDADEVYSDEYSRKTGFHVGFSVDVPFNDYLSFEPNILLTTKGFKYESVIGAAIKTNLTYIEIPLTMKASYDLGGGVKMFGAFGPYVGFGLLGRIKGTAGFEDKEAEVLWGNDKDEDYFKRLDMGLTFGAGFEINDKILGVSYDLGLSNIAANQDNNRVVNNRVLRFSVGLRF